MRTLMHLMRNTACRIHEQTCIQKFRPICQVSVNYFHIGLGETDNADPINKSSNFKYGMYSAIGFLFGYGTYCLATDRKVKLETKVNDQKSSTYPTFSVDDVRKHSTKEDGIWVTYKDGVYDITDFVEGHPGGDVIMMAAGNAVDPFWNLYAVHKQPEILKILETYRIGTLWDENADENSNETWDPYATDPKRNPSFIVNSEKPYNGEPPLPMLVENFITPTEKFYVRNHLPVPHIGVKNYTLEIGGIGLRETSLTLDDLKTKFPKVSVTAAIQCAGNRRADMTKVKPVKGLNWSGGAIGNAVWSGAPLIDVLKYCGLTDLSKIRHIQFEGLDTDVTNASYGASIPAEKLFNPHCDVILAYEMNGESLPLDHGYPLRVIIPGVVGARNVKWLGRIILSEEESSSHWQQNDYKGFSPSTDWDTVDFKSAAAIQELPVISAICVPTNKSEVKLENGKLIVQGYAWSGGGCKILRVDLTADKGKMWYTADIINQEDAPAGRCWSWVLWRAEIPVDKNVEEAEIWAKAVDSNYNVQPESFENIWNLRGVLANAYHRIKIYIVH